MSSRTARGLLSREGWRSGPACSLTCRGRYEVEPPRCHRLLDHSHWGRARAVMAPARARGAARLRALRRGLTVGRGAAGVLPAAGGEGPATPVGAGEGEAARHRRRKRRSAWGWSNRIRDASGHGSARRSSSSSSAAAVQNQCTAPFGDGGRSPRSALFQPVDLAVDLRRAPRSLAALKKDAPVVVAIWRRVASSTGRPPSDRPCHRRVRNREGALPRCHAIV